MWGADIWMFSSRIGWSLCAISLQRFGCECNRRKIAARIQKTKYPSRLVICPKCQSSFAYASTMITYLWNKKSAIDTTEPSLDFWRRNHLKSWRENRNALENKTSSLVLLWKRRRRFASWIYSSEAINPEPCSFVSIEIIEQVWSMSQRRQASYLQVTNIYYWIPHFTTR